MGGTKTNDPLLLLPASCIVFPPAIHLHVLYLHVLFYHTHISPLCLLPGCSICNILCTFMSTHSDASNFVLSCPFKSSLHIQRPPPPTPTLKKRFWSVHISALHRLRLPVRRPGSAGGHRQWLHIPPTQVSAASQLAQSRVFQRQANLQRGAFATSPSSSHLIRVMTPNNNTLCDFT